MKPIGDIAVIFLSIRDNIKVYHWQTHSYARHKASDRLVTSLSDKLDKFIEVLQGSRGERILIGESLPLSNHTDDSIVELLHGFEEWLVDTLPTYLMKKESDLFNIRDEILASVHQALYLFTLN